MAKSLWCSCAVMQPTREIVRPANQLQLSESDLKEEVAKMLTANNPAAPQNLARFNMKERSYKFEPMVEQHVRAPSEIYNIRRYRPAETAVSTRQSLCAESFDGLNSTGAA